jgi:hypothetical protein
VVPRHAKSCNVIERNLNSHSRFGVLRACQQTVFGVVLALAELASDQFRGQIGAVMFVVLAIALVGVMLAVSAVLFGVVRMGSGK